MPATFYRSLFINGNCDWRDYGSSKEGEGEFKRPKYIYIYMYMCNIHSVRGVKRKIREQELFSPLF